MHGQSFVNSAKELDVFQKAYAVSLEIHRRSIRFPTIEQYALGDQMRRASKSVCVNLAEGFAKQRFSAAEFRRFLAMAIGSAGEMEVWIEYCVDLEYIDRSTYERWQCAYSEIAKMLGVLHRKTAQ